MLIPPYIWTCVHVDGYVLTPEALYCVPALYNVPVVEMSLTQLAVCPVSSPK
jgi:hypothetical protein